MKKVIRMRDLHEYVKHINKSFLHEVKNSKEKIKELEKEVLHFYCKLQSAHRKISEEQQRHKIFFGHTTSSEKAKEDYAKMNKMLERGIYKRIHFNNGTCTAETGRCYISYGSQRYFVGRFKIKIERSVKYTNLDYSNNSNPHPHISESKACYGNIDSALAKMLGRKEYPIALELIYRYLNSYNHEGAFVRVSSSSWKWRKVK